MNAIIYVDIQRWAIQQVKKSELEYEVRKQETELCRAYSCKKINLTMVLIFLLPKKLNTEIYK